MGKKLGICGDSFMASMQYGKPDIDNGFNKHFTELLAKKLKLDVVTYAKSGSSNQAIRLQIDEIIKESPDLVIIGTTTTERIEVPIFNQVYNENDGVYNIYHTGSPNISALHPKFSIVNPKMLSTTIHNILTEDHSKFFNEKDIEIFKYWSLTFFDNNWKRQQDSWIISDGLRKLLSKNIDFLCINVCLNLNDLDFAIDRIIHRSSDLNPWNYCNTKKMPKYWFHTELEDQEILAEKWYNFIKDRPSIKSKLI